MAGRRDIPAFSLYGEPASAGDAEFVHVEDIQSRSAPRSWEIDTHTHRGLFQLLTVFEGGAEAWLDGQSVRVAPAAAVAVPAAAVHAFHFQPGTRGYVLTVAEALLFDAGNAPVRQWIESLWLAPRVVDLGNTARELEFYLDRLAGEFRGEAPGRRALVEWLVRIVLLLVARRHVATQLAPGSSRRRAEAFARFRALAEAHYVEHWPVSRYAEALNMTEGRLNRLCRAQSGASAADLLLQRLMLEARRRLIYIAAPVSQVAYDLGYQDPAYFCRIFKRRVGLTPTAFRRQRISA